MAASELQSLESDPDRLALKTVGRKEYAARLKAARNALAAVRLAGSMRITIDLELSDLNIPEPQDERDWKEADYKAIAYAEETIEMIDALSARLAEIEARTLARRSVKGRHRPMRKYAVQAMMGGLTMVFGFLSIRRPWHLVEAVWRDADLGPINGETQGPAFRKELQNYMIEEGLLRGKSLGKKYINSPPDTP